MPRGYAATYPVRQLDLRHGRRDPGRGGCASVRGTAVEPGSSGHAIAGVQAATAHPSRADDPPTRAVTGGSGGGCGVSAARPATTIRIGGGTNGNGARRVRFPLDLPNMAEPDDLVALGTAADAAGWDGVFLWDHVFGGPAFPVAMADPWVVLGALATATRRARIGTVLAGLTAAGRIDPVAPSRVGDATGVTRPRAAHPGQSPGEDTDRYAGRSLPPCTGRAAPVT